MSEQDRPDESDHRRANADGFDERRASADGFDERRASADLAAAGEKHDRTGLDLARQLAQSIGERSRGVRRRRRKPRPDPGPLSSGAHPDDRDPQPLGAAMDQLMHERGWTTQVNVHLLLGRWPRLVGPVNADHSKPETYQDGVLTIRTDSTAWASEMRLVSPQLVARLNGELGDGTVTKVIVKGPDAPSWKHGRRSVRGRGPRDTYG